ncbi:UNVERIFIED_CONTAM: hypothetical protein NCL1_44473 [Trichonephila clavipes]
MADNFETLMDYNEKWNLSETIYLLRMLCSMHFEEGGNINVHIKMILTAVDQLAEIGTLLPDHLVIAFLLYSLPAKYNLLTNLEKISLGDNVCVLEVVKKNILEQFCENDSHCAFEESKSEIKNQKLHQVKGPVFCTNCKRLNHYKRNCRYLKREKQNEKENQENITRNQSMAWQAQPSLQPKKLRNPGVTILKEILKEIKLDENLIKKNNELLKYFLTTFIEEMKGKDDLFKLLYQKPHYTGSYYSDLRISQPDEFDINLVLHLPFKASDFEVSIIF